MNAYFGRTPDSINYDNQQYPGQGDLHDLRVATRDEIERLEQEIANLKSAQLHIEALEARDTSAEPVPVMDMSPEPEKTRRYSLTDAQIDLMVMALKKSAKTDKDVDGLGFNVAQKVLWACDLEGLEEE